VLVTGGFAGDDVIADAELYDPVTATWSGTAPMNAPRLGHSATVLASGRVLVAGGEMAQGVLLPIYPGIPAGVYARGPAAEVYDPLLGVWLPTGTMTARRTSHTATLLADGRVLVAGGYDWRADTQVASAEMYDPRSGGWTPTGGMSSARAGHTAIPTQDGVVLVAGGYRDGAGALRSTERYDPRIGAWRMGPSMSTAHAFHIAALLLDRRVLVAGGRGGGSWTVLAETLAV
jgi:hypothetical protein